MIYTVTLNPALDKTVQIDGFAIDAVNRVASLRMDAGGKGINVSKVIAKLGGRSVAFALLGGATGDKIADMLAADGIECRPFAACGETRTNLKVVDQGLHTNTDINEPGPEVAPGDLDAMLAELVGCLREGDSVVLAGSLPKGAPVDTYATWARACREAGARVFLDADGDALDAGIAAGPYLVKPNDHELAGMMGCELASIDAVADAAEELRARGVEKVVVSMGGEGALFCLGDAPLFAKAPKVKVGSTVGAGDSVVAALAFATECGWDAAATARFAVACGSANVQCAGTQAAELADVEALVDAVEVFGL